MHNPAETPLAIVGMACRLPGADDLDSYWQLLVEGRTVLGDLPEERLDRSLYYDPRKGIHTRSYTTLGGFVEPRPFDRTLCPIPRDYHRSHKAHLNLLEVCAHACRHAGYDPFQMPKLTTGVYVGHTPPSSIVSRLIHARLSAHTAQYLREIPGFEELLAGQADEAIDTLIRRTREEFGERHPALKLNANSYHAVGLISESLRLDGPSMAFDAACASSMRALAHAARQLQLGQVDMALVGSASYCHADTLILFSQAQSLTANRSRPFDEEADGLIASEGYVVVLVKTLDRALADGDRIQAVIRGVGLSSDGKGKSLWAPRGEGQIEAVKRAYPRGFSPARLQYIEAHATSTQLGDATELNALAQVLGEHLPPGKKIVVGSVKGNIGHSLETAGLASILKTTLSMQRGVIPPQCGLVNLNKNVKWDTVPFVIPCEPLAWPDPENGEPRSAAVNAFGIGGLNVHVILEEHRAGSRLAPRDESRTDSRLSVNVRENGPLPQRDGVAIIGMGAVLPGARTVAALWDLFRSAKDMRIECPAERWTAGPTGGVGTSEHWLTPVRQGGYITDFVYDWKKHKVAPKQVAYADPLQFMLLDATDQAFRDAGFDQKPLDRMKTGVVVGTIFGGEFADQLQMGLRLPEFQRTLRDELSRRGVPGAEVERIAAEFETILLKHMPALIDETGSFTASTLSSRLTKTFDLMGGAVAVDSGDASAIAALSVCVDQLLAGDCDLMVCASGQRNMGYAWFLSMSQNGILSQGTPHAPFDARATGTVPGEGVGVLLLKRHADALRDGDRIHAVIRGIGAGRGETVGACVRLAIERGLASSGVPRDNVSMLEAGSVGIPHMDREELAAVIDAFGTPTRSRTLFVGASAGQIGHVGGGNGMMSLLKAVSELEHVEMPPNIGLEQPIAPLAEPNAIAKPVVQPARLTGDGEGRVFGAVDSYSNATCAFHVVLEGPTRVPPTQPAAAPAPLATKRVPETRPAPAAGIALNAQAAAWRLVRVAAASLDELVAKTAALADATAARGAFDAGSSLDALGAESRLAGFRNADRVRIAFVASSADELAGQAGLAAKQAAKPEARGALAEKGIYVGELGTARPRVAFLFPGQGSQYAGMLSGLIAGFGPAARAMAAVDATLARLALPSFADVAWKDGDQLGTDVWRTQLSLMTADTIMAEAAAAMGLRAERLAGHSFGELAALTASSAWTFEDAVRATSARCAAIDACRNAKGALLSTSAPAAVAENICREIGGTDIGMRVSVSHRNAPDQSVVGGDPEAVAKVAERLAAANYRTKMLDVPAAFHTPLMEEVQSPFRKALAQIPLEPPAIPLLSSVTNRYAADPADLRDNLVVQMTQPVHWVELVERLFAEGINVFVEVGPKQVLTGLHKQILAGKPVALVGTDHPKRDGVQQLLFARACVEASGALDLDAPGRGIVLNATRGDAPLAATAPEPSAEIAATVVEAASVQPQAANVLEVDGDIRILHLSGSPFEIGRQHGEAEAENIRRVLRRYADLAGTRWDRFPGLDEAAADPATFFGPDELDELNGIAEGAKVSPAALVAHNLRLYLDVGAGGLHFAVRGERNPGDGLIHAANEDLQRGLSVRDCLTRNIQVRRPANGLAHVAFCVAGQVGTLNGINAAGVAVSTSALIDVKDVPRGERPLHTVLVKRLLEQAADVDGAVGLIRAAKSAGAWTVCLSHHAQDRLCYVEFDGRELKVMPGIDAIAAANHRLMRTHAAGLAGQADAVPSHSQNRLNRLRELLGGEKLGPVALEAAQSALRDRFDAAKGRETEYPTLNTVRRVDNQISILMQPSKDRVWITGGPLSNGHQNDFRCYQLSRWLPSSAQPVAASQRYPSGATRAPVSSAWASRKSIAQAYAAAKGAATSDVCHRYVMRVADAPFGADAATVPLSGPVLILGRNAAANALKAHLAGQGIDSEQIGNDEPEAVLASLDSVWASRPFPHLVLMTGCDADAATALDETTWTARRERGVILPFRVAQRWFEHAAEAKLLGGASVLAVTTMGGDFGFAGGAAAVENGAVSGLAKAIEMETRLTRGAPTFRGKVLDVAPAAPVEQIAALTFRELTLNDGENEVGYLGERRVAARPVPTAVPAGAENIPPGAVFVVTGGARGVTAAVARELGKRFGARLHLVGTSAQPEIPEAWRNLDEAGLKDVKAAVMKEALANGQKPADAWSRFEKALEIDQTLRGLAVEGLTATYHACDVGNRAALAALLDEVRRDGPIQGIIHGAGFERACRFEKKQPDLVDRTIAAKVDGAANLMELTLNDPVKWFAAFGSVSGRFGGVGQADYSVANEMLAKLVDWFRTQRPDCATALFHWHAWDDVGMAVRPESQHIRKLHNIKFMPAIEGTRHLLDELAAGFPEREIVITELDSGWQRYAKDAAADDEPECEPSGSVPSDDRFPLMDRVAVSQPGVALSAEIDLDPARDVFLTQHLFRSRPMMPVVVSTEALVEAAASLAGPGRHIVAVRDVEIVAGLRFPTDAGLVARVHARSEGSRIHCELTGDVINRRGQLLQKDKPYLRGVVETAAAPRRLSNTLPTPPETWYETWYPEEDLVIWHGPVFRCLRRMTSDGGDDAWGQLVATNAAELAGNRYGRRWMTPSTLLDACFFACGVFLWHRHQGVVAIPDGMAALHLGRMPSPGEECMLHIHDHGRDGQKAEFDFTLFGTDGTAIAHVERYRNVIVTEAPAHAV